MLNETTKKNPKPHFSLPAPIQILPPSVLRAPGRKSYRE